MRIALPQFKRRAASPEAALPVFALPLWRLAYIAVGDDRSATALMAEVLALSPSNEGAAVKLLAERLPEGWLTWPGAVGPGEWLRLKLRREQTDRLLSVLGEWSAKERLALGLHLWWDVPREELDAWLGTKNMAVAVAELIAHVGDSLDLLDPPGDGVACAPFRADLWEAHQQHTPQALRLHLLGCEACRTHATGLRRSTELVRHALEIFFRQPVPDDLGARVVAQRPATRQPIALPATLLPVLVVALLIIGLVLRPHGAPSQASQLRQPALSATDVLDRALDRFATAPKRGVFHERVHVGNAEQATMIERWFDDRQRVRVTVHSINTSEPEFDLSSDGKRWISYRWTPPVGKADEALVQPPDVAALLPLLRQLPFVGSFGSMPVDQRSLDVALLVQARRAQPALLGTRRWQNRPAYLLSSTQPDQTRLMLLIDRNSFSLLRAQMIVPNAATPTTVWQAEITEELPSAPQGVFSQLTQHTARHHLNPRHIAAKEATVGLAEVTQVLDLPIPTALPDAPRTSYLSELRGPGFGVLQVYESQWSTLAIATPRITFNFFSRDQLQKQFQHGHYSVSATSTSQVTLAEFVLDRDPERLAVVYFWHALADDAEREQMIVELLDSIQVVDQTNVEQYAERFAAPSAEADATAAPFERISRLHRWSQTLPSEREYLDAKPWQADQ